MRRTLLTCLASLLAAVTLTVAADAKPGEAVVKYAGYKQGAAWGRPCMILLVAPPAGGGQSELIVPNQNPMAMKYDPSPIVLDVVKNLKPGDLIKIRSSTGQGHTILNAISAYTLKPGEDEPNVYTFMEVKDSQPVGQVTYTGVTLGKLGASQLALVPNTKDKDGKLAPDEAILAAVKDLKKDSQVEVQLEKQGNLFVIKSIRAYAPPAQGEFVKTSQQKTEQGDVTVVEIKEAQKNVLAWVPNVSVGGKSAPDAALMSAAKTLKPGQAVMYKCHTDDKGTWLDQIKPAPAAGGK